MKKYVFCESLSKKKKCGFEIWFFEKIMGFSDFPAFPRYLGQFWLRQSIQRKILHRKCYIAYFFWTNKRCCTPNLPMGRKKSNKLSKIQNSTKAAILNFKGWKLAKCHSDVLNKCVKFQPNRRGRPEILCRTLVELPLIFFRN